MSNREADAIRDVEDAAPGDQKAGEHSIFAGVSQAKSLAVVSFTFLVFFLHITTGPDNTNNVLALAFGVLIVGIVIAGSLWIMYHLNINMMVPSEMMDMHTQ